MPKVGRCRSPLEPQPKWRILLTSAAKEPSNPADTSASFQRHSFYTHVSILSKCNLDLTTFKASYASEVAHISSHWPFPLAPNHHAASTLASSLTKHTVPGVLGLLTDRNNLLGPRPHPYLHCDYVESRSKRKERHQGLLSCSSQGSKWYAPPKSQR